MATQNNFHYSSINKKILTENYHDWIIKKKSKRTVKYKFSTHYHPYTDELIETLNRDGLPAILDARYHEKLEQNLTDWYTPGSYALSPFPKEDIDVSDDGPYAIYNWELFFMPHLPSPFTWAKTSVLQRRRNGFILYSILLAMILPYPPRNGFGDFFASGRKPRRSLYRKCSPP